VLRGLGSLAAIAVLGCGARSELLDASGRAPSTQADAGVDADVTPDFAWYRLDETSGTVAHDSSPHKYDIPGLDGVTWGDGATFDGATVCGRTVVDPSFRTPPISITAWMSAAVRADEAAPVYSLFPYPPNAVSGDVPGSGGYGIGLDVWTMTALAIESGVGGDSGFHSMSVPFGAGERHLFAAVTDAAMVTVYVDGAAFAQTSANIPPGGSPTPLHLGCHNDDTGYATKRFFKGNLRDVRIFQKLLTPQQVGALYQAGPV
jgi:hypothetical protein